MADVATLLAESLTAEFDLAHAVAVAAGGEVLHAPQVFPQYHPDYYAFFLDPDGFRIEVAASRDAPPLTYVELEGEVPAGVKELWENPLDMP